MRSSSVGDAKTAGAIANVESVRSGNRRVGEEEGNPWTAPWRFSIELPRAGLSTVVSGVGYLLYVSPLVAVGSESGYARFTDCFI